MQKQLSALPVQMIKLAISWFGGYCERQFIEVVIEDSLAPHNTDTRDFVTG